MTRKEAIASIEAFINSHDVCNNAHYVDNGDESYVLYDLITNNGVTNNRINVLDITCDDHTCYLSTNDDDETYLNRRFSYDWDEISDVRYADLLKHREENREEEEAFWNLFGFNSK